MNRLIHFISIDVSIVLTPAGFVHEVHKAADVIRRRGRENAVAEVENVAGAVGGLVEDYFCLTLDFGPGAQEQNGVEVTLDGYVVAQAGPAGVEVGTPVEADDVAAGVALGFEQVAGVGAEVDRRHAGLDAGEKGFHVGLNVGDVVAAGEVADPTVEELDGVGPGIDLGVQITDGRLRQLRHKL